MTTFFDVVTVTGFVAMVIAFFQFSDRNPRITIHLILVGVVLGIANQIGNSGETLLALGMILAGGIYAVSVIRG